MNGVFSNNFICRNHQASQKHLSTTRFKVNFIVLLIFCAFTFSVKAQDVVMSQFYSAPLYLNPAMSGIAYGPRFTVNYRNQWP
ncbi:MAG TPA: type IX secretion system membrane protein PorP/SprF [Chitinophagales bacterium]|nr:MAG: hypothetical protein BGO32_07280 [Bacteroidetes bacterium 37-13]HRN93135.1 type IX secretion system membrane protein PorP/SprF [Chitinophagales bacterium]